MLNSPSPRSSFGFIGAYEILLSVEPCFFKVPEVFEVVQSLLCFGSVFGPFLEVVISSS